LLEPPGAGFPLYVVEGSWLRHIPDQHSYENVYLGDRQVRRPLSAFPVRGMAADMVSLYGLRIGVDLSDREEGRVIQTPEGWYRMVATEFWGVGPYQVPNTYTLDLLYEIDRRRGRLQLTWLEEAPPDDVAGEYPDLTDGHYYDDFAERGQEQWKTVGGQLRELPHDQHFLDANFGGNPPPSTYLIDPLVSQFLAGPPIPSWADGLVYALEGDLDAAWLMRGGLRHLVLAAPVKRALGIGKQDDDPSPWRPIQPLSSLEDLEGIPASRQSFDFRIEHVVVLMLENRSFDHLFGFLSDCDPTIEGYRGDPADYTNAVYDPVTWTPTTQRVPVDRRADAISRPDPDHELNDVALQVSGELAAPSEAFPSELNNGGFVASYQRKTASSPPGDPASAVMHAFDLHCPPALGRLPVFSRLAREFAVCDHWYASVPGPTYPNRLFAHAGTAKGYAKSPLQDTSLLKVLVQLLSLFAPSVPPDVGLEQILEATADGIGGVLRALGDARAFDNPFDTLKRALDTTPASMPTDELRFLLNSVDQSIYQDLEGHGVTWGIYFHDVCEAWTIRSLRDRFIDQLSFTFDDEGIPDGGVNAFMIEAHGGETGWSSGFHSDGTFFRQAGSNSLPSYSFITPRYIDSPDFDAVMLALEDVIVDMSSEERGEWWPDEDREDAAPSAATLAKLRTALTTRFPANDAHPPHDVRCAELLLARVYDALRNSPAWDTTVLIVLFDEHGGFYDHEVPPPIANWTGEAYDAHIPGFRRTEDPTFDFRRAGVRVPALIISPWVPAGTVDHTHYDHTSLLDAAIRLVGFPIGERRYARFLATFAENFTRQGSRSDCPTNMTGLFNQYYGAQGRACGEPIP
jgi:hypothetical protein